MGVERKNSFNLEAFLCFVHFPFILRILLIRGVCELEDCTKFTTSSPELVINLSIKEICERGVKDFWFEKLD